MEQNSQSNGAGDSREQVAVAPSVADLASELGAPDLDHVQSPNRSNGHNGTNNSLEHEFTQDPPPLHVDGDHVVAAEPENDVSGYRNIEAFAKLSFADGDFYMTTYAVILGRDARSRTVATTKKRAGDFNDLPGRPAKRYKLQRNQAESETGERNNTEASDQSGAETRDENLATIPGSRSSPQYFLRGSRFPRPKKDYHRETEAYETWCYQDSEGQDEGSVDTTQMPPVDKVPLIPINLPFHDDNIPESDSKISREHLKIFFNFAESLFQVNFMGRNGGFVDDEWYAQKETVTLVSGSIIQIGGVCIKFKLPNVADGETGPADMETRAGDRGMDAEDAEIELGDDEDASDSNSLLWDGSSPSHDRNDGESQDEHMYNDDFDDYDDHEILRRDEVSQSQGGVDDEDENEPLQSPPRRIGKAKLKAEPTHEPEMPKPKRKGPGRPPKNGIMSKREQAQQAREARENARAKVDGKLKLKDGRGKVKTSKAHELEASHLQPNGKRKYTKRKKVTDTENAKGIRESTEQDESPPPETTTKPAKDKKPIKPPRSPSPVFNEAELTAEQLAKPQASYVVLIHEALTNSKTGQMSLPQIYRAIERRYPFFKLRVQTQGWQSSVRHNLSQHAAFTKIERDGKGWMWGLVPSVSIEKEKKRRPSPPAAPQQNYQYSAQQPRYPPYSHPYPYPNLPGQGQGPVPFQYPVPPIPYAAHLGPKGIPLPFAQPQTESTYRSPYDSNADATKPQAASSAAPASTPTPTPGPNVNGQQNPAKTPQPSSKQPYTIPTPAATPASARNGIHTTSNTTPHYSDEILARVNAFKTALIKSLDQVPNPESLITSVIDHKLYGKPLSADAGPEAAAILKPLENIILAGVHSETTDTSRTAPGTSPPEQPKSQNGASNEDTVAGKATVIARKIQTEDTGGEAK